MAKIPCKGGFPYVKMSRTIDSNTLNCFRNKIVCAGRGHATFDSRTSVVRTNQPNRAMRTRRLVFAVAILLLPWIGLDVYGCQCREREPPCAQYSSADAVFIGLVANISFSKDKSKKSIHFNVERAFRGVSSSVAEIVTFGTSCDSEFTEGKRYLVYAYRNGERNELYTHYCTRTTELSNADEDMTYLKELSEREQPMQIIGVLAEGDKRLHSVSIVARNGRRDHRTTSDKKGWFKLMVLRSGNYRVRIFLPRYADVVGTEAELGQIKNRVVTKRSIALEYEVVVEPGKCAFINPPLFIDRLEYEKHGGTNPQNSRNKRSHGLAVE